MRGIDSRENKIQKSLELMKEQRLTLIRSQKMRGIRSSSILNRQKRLQILAIDRGQKTMARFAQQKKEYELNTIHYQSSQM
jgi:hypothetical protein